MQETQELKLRRSSKAIETLVRICFILLIGISTIQPISKTYIKKEANATATAEINQHFDEVLKEQTIKSLTTSLTAGTSRNFMEVLKETNNQPKVEKLELETVTTSAKIKEMAEVDTEDVEDAEPSTLYKSIEEVKISRNMYLTETTGLSREDFCELLANFKYDYEGFYSQNAGLIWDLSQEYQVNEIFLCGVFALESYYGSDDRHVNAHNYGSIMNKHGELVVYESDAEGIEANFKLFANCYLSPEGKYYKGVTIDSIGDTYCPPTTECPSWADKVYCCMQYFLE